MSGTKVQRSLCSIDRNSSAPGAYPKTVLGFDVSTINSVQFSNHTGYKCFKGQVLNSDDLACLYDGLQENGISSFSHILTGYIGSQSFLEKVAEIVVDLKKKNPSLVYVCDPVMGDNGEMYVPAELLPVYIDKILPIADIVTPNQFEVEKLTGIKITSEEDAIEAMKILHSRGPKTVVISSSEFSSDGSITSLASTVANGKKEVYKVQFQKLNAVFVGTGDLFAACLLAWLEKDKDLKLALEKTIATLQSVIKRTFEKAKALAGEGNRPTPAQMELQLVQSKTDIEAPPNSYNAVVL
uniref:Pyridoxal kinase n=1 Tax=Magallana gigas TaxID=29159 RepID=A0A8W8JC83_MAGGI